MRARHRGNAGLPRGRPAPPRERAPIQEAAPAPLERIERLHVAQTEEPCIEVDPAKGCVDPARERADPDPGSLRRPKTEVEKDLRGGAPRPQRKVPTSRRAGFVGGGGVEGVRAARSPSETETVSPLLAMARLPPPCSFLWRIEQMGREVAGDGEGEERRRGEGRPRGRPRG